MRTTRLMIIATATLYLLFSGCKKDEPTYLDLGYAYFPTDTGRWIEYQVDTERVHQAPNDTVHLTLSDPLREKVTENFIDPEGRHAQRMIRYTKDQNGTWQPKDVWWQARDNVRAERSEENLRRVKLVFPPHTSTFWNTNATNTADDFELAYEEIDVPWSMNGLSFDSTVLVVGTYQSNPILTKIYRERYAKHVGLVYREVDSSETQATYFDRYHTTQVITAYGH